MRVVIVADGKLAADAVRQGLRYTAGIDVIGYVDSTRRCGPSVQAADADLVLVNDREHEQASLDRVAEIRAAVPEIKIILLTRDMDPDWLSEACRAGIDAAVSSAVASGGLGTLVRQIVGGEVFHAFAQPPAAEVSPAIDQLTARELQILRLAASGSSNGRIAQELWVTEQTVKFHLSNIYRKLDVVNRTQASHIAYVNGLIDPAPPKLAPVPSPVAA